MALPGSAARGAARPHSPPAPRAPLRSPRWLTQTSALRRGAQSHPDRRPARAVQTGRAPAGHRAVPPPPRRALPLPGGVERGGEQPPPASQAGALTGQVFSKQALGSRLGAQRALRPALGSPRVSPQAQGRLRLQTFLPTSSTAPTPQLFLASLFLGVCFMGSTLVMEVPDEKGVEATKPLAHTLLPAHPQNGRAALVRCQPGISMIFKSASIS